MWTRLVCLALFLCDEDSGREICLKYGVEYDRLKVIRAAVVKANSDADMGVKTMIRRENVLEMVNQDEDIKWDCDHVHTCKGPRLRP